ncbi:MAG TPA: S9 family peptidase [Gemmatimonadetes bacterium]|jgi:dipeptidyl aminopeptidase/acylaminoacyl peptidase|nr:S9 family peptidase [Gemmatimonadota bacterium]
MMLFRFNPEKVMRNLTLLIVFVLAVPVAGQERRAMTTDDGLDMVQVGGAMISPDGSWVLFSKSELNWEENERKTTWWRVSAEGGEPYRYIGDDGGGNFQFSPDGRRLAFTRSVDDESQLFLLPTTGGEAVQLSEHETSIGSYAWSEDGSKIIFVATEPRTDEEEEAREAGYDAIFVDEGPNGQQSGNWNNLWLIEVESGAERRLTDTDHRIGSFSVAPNGDRILFTSRIENRRNQQNLSEIQLLEVETGTIRQLTDNSAPEGRLSWAPDGRSFAYTARTDGEWELLLDKIWVMDPDGGGRRIVSGAFDGNIGNFVWAPDASEILFSGLHGTNNNLYRINLGSDSIEQITSSVGSLAPSSFSRDRAKMAYVFQDFDTPADIWVGLTDGTGAVQLTDVNSTITDELVLGQGEVIRWESRDGTEIEGILMLPAEYQSGVLPLLLHIHGGPAGVFRNSFSASNHVWAGLGYAQLFPNVRGSSGYDDDLLRGNLRDIGSGDYEDLMTGVDELISRGIADPDKLGLRGWSYGGILGGWTITQTDRFKGASVGAMVSDWTSEYGPGFNHDVRLWYIGGTPWDNTDEWRERSALTHVANVTTPTLVLHGINDRTDTEPQSMMFFQALKDQGKITRYIRFPREPHGFQEPRHQRTRDVEEIRWIQKYVRNIEWTPWERPEKDDKKVVS